MSYRDAGSLISCEVSHCPRKKGLSCDHGRQERQHLREPRLRGQALAGRRQAAQQHGRGRVQARRPRPHLPQVHLRRLRGAARPARSRERARGRRPRRPGRVPGRQHLLGAQGGPLGVPPGQRQAAHHRQARRRRDGRHRARQPLAQGRAAQGLRPPRPRQAAPGRAHRPDRQHRPGRQGEPLQGHPRAASTSTSSPSSPAPRARRAASSTRPRCVVQLLVEMLAPYKGRVYDPCCGSGGMFVQTREVRRGARRPDRRHQRLRPGVEPHHLAAGAR